MTTGLGCRALKVEDVARLRELLAEHVEVIEPGLRVLETRPLLGGSSVDLVALDARAGLVLVAVGIVADDRMLLRMLDAYSWCLESPETLVRRYRVTRLPAGGPPRVVFVAERLPDAFLRNVKHVRFSEVQCLEFRYLEANGARLLHLHPVPLTLAADPAGELPPAARPPAPREAPSVGPPDAARVRIVAEYLHREFPTCILDDFYDHAGGAQVFQVLNGLGTLVYRVAVAADFLTTQPETGIKPFLDRHKLAAVLREAGQLGVLVTGQGLRAERP
jgi:hypothetical protein